MASRIRARSISAIVGARDVARLMGDAGIVRSRAKIDAAIRKRFNIYFK